MDSNEHQIGLFYIIDGKVYKRVDKVCNIKADFWGFKNYPKSHYECWDHICSDLQKQNRHKYDYYPRGRVVYSTIDDTFFVWLDKYINDFRHQKLICNAFGVNSKNTVFEPDEIYKCAKCKNNG